MERLPPELRLRIYRELLLDEDHYLEPQGKHPDDPPYESKVYPAILGVCKQFYAEASAVLYEENEFGYEYRTGSVIDYKRNLSFADNSSEGPFKRIKHLQIRYTEKGENRPSSAARKLTAVVQHIANFGCALKTIFLQLQFCAEREGQGAAARIAHSHELIKTLADLDVNNEFVIYLESVHSSDCKRFEPFASQIGLENKWSGWSITLTTRISVPFKDYIKNNVPDEESVEDSDGEGSAEDELNEEEAQSDHHELPSAVDQSNNLQGQDDSRERSEDSSANAEELDDERRVLLDYDEENNNWDDAIYIWTWKLKPTPRKTSNNFPRYGS